MYSSKKRKMIVEQRPVLFHGTDARIVALAESERKGYLEDCWSLAQKLWDYIGPVALKNSWEKFEATLDEHSFRLLTLASSIYYHSKLKGNTLFEYNSLYVSSNEEVAWRYARRARFFGETGLVAYGFSNALLKFPELCSPEQEIKDQMKLVARFAETPSQPMVVAIDKYDPNLLRTECGESVQISRHCVVGSIYRYDGDIDLTAFPIMPTNEKVLSEPWLL